MWSQEKERLEKKAAKAEKERKEKQAQDKSRSLMASFFTKPKTKASLKSTPSVGSDAVSGSAIPGPSQSEFEKTFKPFSLKKDTELAPTNWFQYKRRKARGLIEDEVVVLDGREEDDEDVVMENAESIDIGQMTAEGRLPKVPSTALLLNNSKQNDCEKSSLIYQLSSIRAA